MSISIPNSLIKKTAKHFKEWQKLYHFLFIKLARHYVGTGTKYQDYLQPKIDVIIRGVLHEGHMNNSNLEGAIMLSKLLKFLRVFFRRKPKTSKDDIYPMG